MLAFEGEKLCSTCNQYHPEDNFQTRRVNGQLLKRAQCKPCYNARARKAPYLHKPGFKEKKKEYNKAYKRSKGGSDWKRDNDLKYKFGITLEDFNRMKEDQNNCCFICGVHELNLNKGLVVDHNHTTGKVRKLLCSNCNVGIGQFKENIEVMNKAIAYLVEQNKE